ncbi:neutral/alkaline ceramidase [Streptoalloteichus hindustanus]|uniref:Neutral ceramidase n=1 Tax=Streptoalloteichus hindustanus TaxID=2017 RepID=A0A1M5BFR1_STRHI|nr:neutral/alkaline ceramidase [Streptoalloteichus hindustanus]SHF41240.1 neutral ceramidase [Streptoalloteichus hindustanus]
MPEPVDRPPATPVRPPLPVGRGSLTRRDVLDGHGFLVGRGIADITGEPAEVGMMGYASPGQRTSGIHLRQRSRAFVFVDRESGQRVALVTVDLAMVFAGVRHAVLEALARRFGDRYDDDSLLIAATHTHAGPGGFAHHTLYNITSLGFRPRTFDAIVAGVVESVALADRDLAPATVSIARGELTDASVNRSRRAFERNPAADRAAFPTGIDPTTTVLRVDRAGRPVGMINWFATHNTSMTVRNTLISGDNKGYAAYHWEREVAGVDYRADAPGFVAAFAQTNAGDASPNLHLRPGSGPTEDEVENTRIIGLRQFEAARRLWAGPRRPLAGGVATRRANVDMSALAVRPEFTGSGRVEHTGAATLGASFAAGSTEDGGGGLPVFGEGVDANPAVRAVSRLLYRACPDLRRRQAPKDVLLTPGLLGWTPKVLPLHLVRLGSLHLVGVPHEVTAVAGLRLRRTVADALGVSPEDVLVAGYANSYAGYLTTPEEYDQQDYEGGHTMYGRWQLPAYQQEFARLAADLLAGRPSDRGPALPDRSGEQVRLRPDVVLDAPPPGRRFGEVVREPAARYRPGQRVRVEFVGAHPNNDLHRGGTYLEVQRREGDGWRTVADDGDWSTRFRWSRWGLAASRIEVSWDVPPRARPGEYRVTYHGDARGVSGRITAFHGASRVFTVA